MSEKVETRTEWVVRMRRMSGVDDIVYCDDEKDAEQNARVKRAYFPEAEILIVRRDITETERAVSVAAEKVKDCEAVKSYGIPTRLAR